MRIIKRQELVNWVQLVIATAAGIADDARAAIKKLALRLDTD
jgi:hypothetical protein